MPRLLAVSAVTLYVIAVVLANVLTQNELEVTRGRARMAEARAAHDRGAHHMQRSKF